MNTLDSNIDRLGLVNAQLQSAKEIFEQFSKKSLSKEEQKAQAELGMKIVIGSRATLTEIEKNLAKLNS